MTWARFDDQMYQHPKLLAAGAVAELIQYRAIQYCSRFLTDGFIPAGAVSQLLCGLEHLGFTTSTGGRDVLDVDWPAELVLHGLWERRRGGYFVHDFLDYNRTKHVVMAERHAKSVAGRNGARATNARRWRSADAAAGAAGHAASRADTSADAQPMEAPSLPLPVLQELQNSALSTRGETPLPRARRNPRAEPKPAHAPIPNSTRSAPDPRPIADLIDGAIAKHTHHAIERVAALKRAEGKLPSVAKTPDDDDNVPF